MKFNDFKESLEFGNKWEEVILKQLKNVLPSTELVRFEDNPDLQRKGVDLLDRKRMFPFEIKTRYTTKYFDDILFETISDIERETPGWYYYTMSPALVYNWVDAEKNQSVKIYIMNIFKIRNRRIVEKAIEKLGLKPLISVSYGANRTWYTENYAVPITFIPADSIIQYSVLNQHFERDLWRIFD
ncbi:MAG: hypothetical protein QXV17_09550 [Candidatus Micrarchaeaceae archaeon]